MNEQQEKLTEAEISQILRQVGPLETPPDDMTERVRAAVKSSWEEEVKSSRQTSWFRYAAAVAVVSGSLYLGLNFSTDVTPVVASIDSDVSGIEVSSDGVRWQAADDVALVEGTYLRAVTPASVTFEQSMNVRLNAMTRLEVISGSEVHLINGELYLDSYNAATEEQFVVSTRFGNATDIGTQFQVSAYENNWVVQVREGQVNMQDGDFSIAILPGKKITIAENNAVEQAEVAPHDPSWKWAEQSRPAYTLAGKKIDDYLSWVARETGRELKYRSDAAASSASRYRLRGSMSISRLSADESLEVVLPTTNLQLVESEENVIMVDSATSL